MTIPNTNMDIPTLSKRPVDLSNPYTSVVGINDSTVGINDSAVGINDSAVGIIDNKPTSAIIDSKPTSAGSYFEYKTGSSNGVTTNGMT